MKIFYQKESYPFGDCFRTCLASIMESDNLEDIPNFMRDGEENFDNHLKEWLFENNLLYLTITIQDGCLSNMINNEVVVLTGKKKADNIYHSVVGLVEYNIAKNCHEFKILHDPLGIDIEDSFESFSSFCQVGFLSKKI